MFSDKLKKLIVEFLLKDLMRVEIIYYKDSIWFIDREQRYWYFEYHKEDILETWCEHDERPVELSEFEEFIDKLRITRLNSLYRD